MFNGTRPKNVPADVLNEGDLPNHEAAPHDYATLMLQQLRLIEAAHEAMFVRTWAGVITTWNRGAEKLYGFSRAEALGQTTHQLLQTVDLVDSPSFEAALLADGRWQGDVRQVTKEGRTIVVESRQTMVEGPDGQHLVLECNCDVTVRKQTEEALRQSEATLSAVLDALPVGVVIADATGRIVRVNAANNAIWGVPPETSSWEEYSEWVGYWPSTGERIKADEWAMSRALLTGEVITGELVECEQFGTRQRRLYVNNAAPVRNAAGAIIGGVVAELDVTEARQAEAALLRRSEQLHRLAHLATRINAAQAIAPLLHLVVDEARPLIGAHQASISLTSDEHATPTHSAVSLSEKYARWQGASAGSDRADVCAEVCRMKQPLRLSHAELDAHPAWRHVTPTDEQHLPMRGLLAVPLVGRDGRTIGVVQLSDKANGAEFSADDEAMLMQLAQLAAIALENLQLYAQEQAARAQAEAANRLKDEFLANVSHELRTPLTAFLGYAHVLQFHQYNAVESARILEKMVMSAEIQAQLIDDLLDVSRMVSGKLRVERQPIDLTMVIHSAIDTVQPMIEAKQIRLNIALDPAARLLHGDASRLQQVIWNLLTNAAKFTPPEGRILVRLVRRDDTAVLTISDTGQGISAAFLPHVFERFRQADSTMTRAHGGLGLGLSIVRHLVELHGGSVEAASAGEWEGATFTVRLPLAQAAEPALPTDPVLNVAANSDCVPELVGLRVLLVDDQPAILEFLAETLSACGTRVRTCTDAQAALELVRTWRPDVIVSDIAMPNHDGYWLMRQVRSLAPEQGGTTPAVALTAYVRLADRRRVLAAGFQQYLPKPVEPAELRDTVATLACTSVNGGR